MTGLELGAVVGLLKGAEEVAKGIKEAEIKADLLGQLVDVQTKVLEFQAAFADLQDENRNLRRQLEDREAPADYTFRDGLYWKGEEGPFCAHCTPQGKPVPLTRFGKDRGGGLYCAVCEKSAVVDRVSGGIRSVPVIWG